MYYEGVICNLTAPVTSKQEVLVIRGMEMSYVDRAPDSTTTTHKVAITERMTIQSRSQYSINTVSMGKIMNSVYKAP